MTPTVDGAKAAAPDAAKSSEEEAAELLRDVEFYARHFVEMAQKEVGKPALARKLDWLWRLVDELGETYETLTLDGHGK